jgi:hypothetical protein
MQKKILPVLLCLSTFMTTDAMAAEWVLLNKLPGPLAIDFGVCVDKKERGEQECTMMSATVAPGQFLRGPFYFIGPERGLVGAVKGRSGNRQALFGSKCFAEIYGGGQQAILIFEPYGDKGILCIPADKKSYSFPTVPYS